MVTWTAILSTDGTPPAVGDLLLVAMPTATTNPHGIGRILSVAQRPGGPMPTVDIVVEIECDDDARAKRTFPRDIALDCYADRADAERCHMVDVEHFERRGFARNHWRDLKR